MWQSAYAMDPATFVTIAAKALVYLASLIAAGSALSLAGFSTLDVDTMRMVRRLGLAGAFVAGLASVALVPMGAVYLAGGSWAGAFDPALASMVAESPIGESIVVRIAGLALIAALFVSRRTPGLVCVAGAGIVCASFALRGHVMAEPRVLLGVLVTAHLLGLAARNRLRLTPALLAGDAGAGVRLRRSIGLEFAAVLAILATTATLTTIASPDMEG